MFKFSTKLKDQIVIWLSIKPLRFIWYYLDLWQARKNHRPKIKKLDLQKISKLKQKLIVFYRIYPQNNGKSPIFKQRKLQLTHFCLESFYQAFKKQQPYVIFLLDGCSQKYVDLINSYQDLDKMVIRYRNAGRMYSFLYQLTLARAVAQDKYVYFAEDDYFYLANAGQDLISGLNTADFFCLNLLEKRNYLRKIDSWRQYLATSMTFGTKSDIIHKYFQQMRKAGSWDHPFWLNMYDLGLKLYSPLQASAFHMVKELIPKVLLQTQKWRLILDKITNLYA